VPGTFFVDPKRFLAPFLVGAETALKANPDGYKLLLISATYTSNAALYKLPYNPVYDAVPGPEKVSGTFSRARKGSWHLFLRSMAGSR
jgi:hypothetical protein